MYLKFLVYKNKSKSKIYILFSTGGWKIYQRADLRISQKVVAPINEKQGLSLTLEDDPEDNSQQLEEKMDKFQDIDKDDRCVVLMLDLTFIKNHFYRILIGCCCTNQLLIIFATY